MLTIRRLPEGTCQPQIHIYQPPRKPRICPIILLGGILNCLVLFPFNEAHGHLNTSRTWTVHDCICDHTVKAVPGIVFPADTAYPLSSLGFTPSFDFNATVSLWVSETT